MSVYYWLCIRAIPKKRAMEVLTQLKYSNDLRSQQSWKSKKNFFCNTGTCTDLHWYWHWHCERVVGCVYCEVYIYWYDLVTGTVLEWADPWLLPLYSRRLLLLLPLTVSRPQLVQHCKYWLPLPGYFYTHIKTTISGEEPPSLSSTPTQNNSSPSVLCDRSTISRELFLEGQFPRIRF